LHRYLHYAVVVVDAVVKSLSIGPKELIDLADGPSAETLNRWATDLTSLSVRSRLLRRLPDNWEQAKSRFRDRTEQACTWLVAEAFGHFFKLKLRLTGLLQRMRLSLMKRYGTPD
jgi:hypothetical protein